MTRHVVVGWDGSAAAAGALDWGVRHNPQAESVEIVEVDEPGGHRAPSGRDAEEAARLVREAHPGIEVTVAKERGDVVEVLADRSAPAGLVVLGGRGNEQLRRGHRTSKAYRVVLQATGPVAVVPSSYTGGRDVVVGVTGDSDAPCVALTAAAEAARRRQRLVALYATRPLFGFGALPGEEGSQRHDEEEYHDLLRKVLAPVRAAYPGLPVVPRIVRGRTTDVLLAESRTAMVLVLGREETPANHRPVTHSSMLLSRAPVIVVPPETVVG